MKESKEHGNKGNKSAMKYKERLSSTLHIRVTPTNKAMWVKASYPNKMSEWIIDTLNKAAKDKLNDTFIE